MNNQFLEKLKNKVEAGEVKQLSPREVFLKHYVLWLYVALAIIFSSIVLGRIFFVLDTSDMPIWQHLYPSFSAFLLATFPYFWTIMASIFIILAADRVRKTEFGYRYTWKLVLSIAISLSLIGGFIMYALGMGTLFNLLEANDRSRNDRWQISGDGRISGQVLTIATSSFEIVDENGNSWAIVNNPLTKGIRNVATNSQVKIVGFEYATSSTPKQFVACIVLPSDGRPISREIKERFFSQGENQDLMQEPSVLDDKDKQYIFDRCREVLDKGRANMPPPCCKPVEDRK